MKLFRILISVALVITLMPFTVRAQEPKSPEQMEKEMREAIDKEVEKYIRTLDLDMAQEFYVDSILTHDYNAMREELMEKSRAKVSNSDVYVAVQDKWAERIYVAFRKVLDDDQWAKYLKSGAARDKKARDKREAKRTAQ
ncbi:MAG: hypothetical protein IKS71_04505 [Bacteroidales bacterium]|nr:hypothetical protein [Bacteroidales bacterium]